MEQIISKEELEEIKNIKGELTGEVLKNDLDFVLQKEGEGALERVKVAMENVGYPINDIKLTNLYPLAMGATLIIVIKKIFSYGTAELEEMGRMEAKISSHLIRIFMRYFISLSMVVNNVQRMWQEYYKVGRVSMPDYDTKKGYAIFRIENFKAHIFLCQLLGGYFAATLELIVGKKVSPQETKCVHKGDEYHEFLLKW